jgi:AraC-like DNA-binding protein
MKYVYLIAVFNALLFIVLLFQKKPRALHDNILIYWLTYLGLFIGVYTIFSHDLFSGYKLLSISLISFLMLHGPFLYLYIQSLVSGKQRLFLKDLVHLIPFFLFNLYILVTSFNPVASEKLNIEKLSREFDPAFLFLFFLMLTALSGTLYFVLTIRLFRKLDIRIFNNYSYSADLDLSWLRWLVLVFGIVWTVLICITVIHHVFNMFSIHFCSDGLFLSLSAFVILIGYFGFKQKVIFSAEEIVVNKDTSKALTKYAGSRLTETEARQYAEKLTEYMNSSQPYLNPGLTLSTLAGDIGVSSHHLSQVINEKFGHNFFDFINGYRVESFKSKISDPGYRDYSFLGIALDCGFNSKSAFNRIFKQKTGLTPSQYKNTLLENAGDSDHF